VKKSDERRRKGEGKRDLQIRGDLVFMGKHSEHRKTTFSMFTGLPITGKEIPVAHNSVRC